MTQKNINIGEAPGNLGDGDTLRNAFIKTNDNFNELYSYFPVTDTTLNHDDPNVKGTIASALAEAGKRKGGLVLVGPGKFTCKYATLNIPGNVILRGSGKGSTIIESVGNHDAITILDRFSAVESLQLSMPVSGTSDGIKIRTNYVHLRDLMFVGGSYLSWAINADRVNVCKIDNVTMGTIGPYNFTGNGILFQNTDSYNFPFNFGDSMLVKIDINLSRSNTTGIKFHGPDDTDDVINNILLSQVEVIVENSMSGCIGLHLRNAKRITCNHVDLENLDIAILEESVGTGNNVSSNNSFIATFIFGSNISYKSAGIVNRRLFIGCDNLTPDNLNDNDTMLPRALWLSDNSCKIEGPGVGQLTINDGSDINGLRFKVGSENPVIKANSSNSAASVTIGDNNSRGVKCLPGIILPAYDTIPEYVSDGTIMQFNADIVGSNRGLYQLRGNIWEFIA